MKKIVQILLVGFLGIAMQSCYYDEAIPTDDLVIPPGTVLTYKVDVAPLLTPSCTACHSAGATAPNLANTRAAYDNLIANSKKYVVKGNSGASVLYNVIKNGNHFASLNPMQLAILKAWIDSDAKYE